MRPFVSRPIKTNIYQIRVIEFIEETLDMSWKATWDDVWTFINPQDLEFLAQLDDIINSSTPEHAQIILKNAPQSVKNRYNTSLDYSKTSNLPVKLTPNEREHLYKSLGITEKSIQRFSLARRTSSNSWIDHHITYKIIQSFFGGLRFGRGR